MYAQNTEKVALLSVFETLEIKHSIRFSYATNEVTNIKITPPSINYSLKESLTYLAENTPFLFTQIDERYITVVLKVQENIFCGKLIDVTSGFPLEGASVTTKNNSFSTLSNSEGIFFVSKINTSETINISYVGFETIQIPVSKLDNSCGSILMLFLFFLRREKGSVIWLPAIINFAC